MVKNKFNDEIFEFVRWFRDSGVEIFCFVVGGRVDVYELVEIVIYFINNYMVMVSDGLLKGVKKFIELLEIVKVEFGNL